MNKSCHLAKVVDLTRYKQNVTREIFEIILDKTTFPYIDVKGYCFTKRILLHLLNAVGKHYSQHITDFHLDDRQ